MNLTLLKRLSTPAASLPESLTINGREIPVVMTHHSRARRMTLRYDSVKRCIRLTTPKRTPQKLAARFLQEKVGWLEGQIGKQPENIPFEAGAMIPILGSPRRLEHIVATRGQVALSHDEIRVPAPEGHLPQRTRNWLKTHARGVILAKAEELAAPLELKFRRVAVRDMSSRWGSCSYDGNLSFSWRLIFAPEPILSYLVAHELAHLKEMNHSKAFWDVVAIMHPDHKTARAWLKVHAGDLHRYG